MPIMVLIGVRSSFDILARNMNLAVLALFASSFACLNSSRCLLMTVLFINLHTTAPTAAAAANNSSKRVTGISTVRGFARILYI